MVELSRYPIGTQSFEVLRNTNSLYVDKTEFVYKLAYSSARTYFLSRPRRFGKSLFLSTLEAFFSGRKDLFEGLAIYNLEKEWAKYPVIHIDLSPAEAKSSDFLANYVETRLRRIAEEYGVSTNFDSGIGTAFGYLIEDIAHKTGKQVVVLIDEYDKGIVEVLDDETKLEANQDILRPFFSQIKAQNANIRFCFITGVARFSHYTLFSGFNNPEDLSMDPQYASICGITSDELIANFASGIQSLAEDMNMCSSEVIETLKQKYDGYRFTRANILVFNPFSILNCLSKKELSNFWLKSGTSRVFISYLSKCSFNLEELTNLWVSQEDLEGTFRTDNPISLLFQTGYLTIKDYDDGLYLLGLPNGEVRGALVKELIPKFMGVKEESMPRRMLVLKRILNNGDVYALMQELTSLIASVPYHELDYTNIEKTYHLIVYSIFLMIGVDVRSEIAISGGRIDMVATSLNYVYVMEFKLNGTAQEALDQINSNGYTLPWKSDVRKVIKIGITFSSDTHTIADWKAESE